MRKALIILPLIAIGLFLSCPGMGLNPPSDAGSSQELIWHSINASGGADRLTDEGVLAAQKGENGLWIADLSDKDKRTSLEIPLNNWAKLDLAPSIDGELKLYCLYPTGSTDLLLTGQVRKGHSYKAWYHSQGYGEFEVWYTVNDSRSNSVRFNVTEALAEDMVSAYPSTAIPGSGGSGLPISRSYTTPAPAAAPYAAAPAPSPTTSIGFSTGGAKDIGNFRENIENGYLPLPTDITYEGLFYDYYFDTGQAGECKKLFCPSYSYAITKDPFSREAQYYLSVGLNSGLTDFKRKKLNLVVVLDNSGSMGDAFDQYYYDRFGNRIEQKDSESSGKKKMEIADKVVSDLLDHLNPDDRFGLVTFSDYAILVDPLTSVGDKRLERLKGHILDIQETGSTNMEAGMELGTRLLSRLQEVNQSQYENRIIFLTDAMPNMGEIGKGSLSGMLNENSDNKIYTTFIGIGVDFNTELVDFITKTKGANYYSVHSASEFKQRMDEEFDYMVTPLVFDLQLKLDAPGYKIEKVYGSPEADEATGRIMYVNTLFPSKAQEGQVKGGVVLIKLKKLSSQGMLKLNVSYKDGEDKPDSDEAVVEIKENSQGNGTDFYQNNGIRKAILLTRYADLLKDWIIDERKGIDSGKAIVPAVTFENGIVVPVILGEWERQSVPLAVAEPYKKLFGIFGTYYQDQMKAIGDDTMQQELTVLDRLSKYEGSGRNSVDQSNLESRNSNGGFWGWLSGQQ